MDLRATNLPVSVPETEPLNLLMPRPASQRVPIALAAIVVVVGLVAAVANGAPKSPAAIARGALPSVVVLRVHGSQSPILGSGFVVGDDLIVTNYHVVQDAVSITVETASGDSLRGAYVSGVDAASDLAILRVPDLKLPPLRLAGEGSVQQGSRVFALGHPEGLAFTLSEGLVSSIREVSSVRVLQITAPISQGSSGGPVIDERGEVIGVTTSYLGDGQNLNFAVRASHIRDLLEGSSEQDATGGQFSRESMILGPEAIAPGVYALTYRSGSARDELALHLTSTRDSLVGWIGGADSWEEPTRYFSMPAAAEVPFTVELGRPDVTLEIAEIASSRLFMGDFVIRSHGEVRRSPFTATWRHQSLATKSLVLLGPPSKYRQFGVITDVRVTGELVLRDVGKSGVAGTFRRTNDTEAGEASAPIGDSVLGTIEGSESLLMHFGRLTCQVRLERWPEAFGSCWAGGSSYGIVLVPADEPGTSRSFWRALPPSFAGVIEASREATGGIGVTYLSGISSGEETEPSRAIRTFAEAYPPPGDTLPWPVGVNWFDYEVDRRRGFGVALLRGTQVALRRDDQWTTHAVDEQLFPEVLDEIVDISVLPLKHERYMVEFALGAVCGYFLPSKKSPDQINTARPCRRVFGLYDASADRWKRIPGQISHRPNEFGSGFYSRLSDSSAYVKVLARGDVPRGQATHHVVTPSGVRRVAPPLASDRRYVSHVGSTALGSDGLWAVVLRCARNAATCQSSQGANRSLVRWEPGIAAVHILTDSGGLLADGRLDVTDNGRVLFLTSTTVRAIDDFEYVLSYSLFNGADRIVAILEDTISGRVDIISHLGEVATVALRPRSQVDDEIGQPLLRRLWSRLRLRFGG